MNVEWEVSMSWNVRLFRIDVIERIILLLVSDVSYNIFWIASYCCRRRRRRRGEKVKNKVWKWKSSDRWQISDKTRYFHDMTEKLQKREYFSEVWWGKFAYTSFIFHTACCFREICRVYSLASVGRAFSRLGSGSRMTKPIFHEEKY